MKKKFFKILIIFSFLFCISNVDANECVNITISNNSGVSVGNYKYKYWDKKTWTEVVQGSLRKSYVSSYTSSSAALSACNHRPDVKSGKAKCVGTYINYGTKYVCYGKSYSTQAACKNATYSSTTNKCISKKGTCTKRSGIHLIEPYQCPYNTSITGNQADCNSKCVYYTCSSTGGKYSTSTCNSKCNLKCSSNSNYCKETNNYNSATYGYTYRSISSIEQSESTLKDGFGDLNIFEYKTDGGDRTYCIQPGKKGPGGNEYCINEVFDLHRCKTENHYYCGLADILYQTVKEDGTYSDGSVKFVDNGKYDYPEITTALRMWLAYAAKGKLELGDDEVITGIEDASLDYVSNTNVYLNTAEMVINGYNGLACSGVGLGVLCGDNPRYMKAIELFRNALKSDHDFIKYESDEAGEPELSDTSTTEGGEVTFKVVAKLPESYQEKMVDCTRAELLDKKSGCKVYAELKDKNGKVVNGQIEDAKCEGKETCEFVIKAQRKECSMTGGDVVEATKYTLNFSLKEYDKGGYVRQYVNAAGADVSQVMMTFAFNEKKNEIDGTGDPDKKYTLTIPYELPVPCYCDSTKYCDDFKAKGNLKTTCQGYGIFGSGAYDTYEKSNYEDPYMNCILNACDLSKKEEFSYTKETGANDKVCNIYCRKELTFYLANKTKVYAGMQFSYDIASKVLEGEGDIEKVLTTDHKLTSIVLQKRQCTSEIYYNKKNADGKTWIEQYDAAVKKMISAYNDWKKIEVLYDWEDKNGGPNKITACAKNSYTGSGSCGNDNCDTISNACGEKTIHTWPKYDYVCNPSTTDSITSDSEDYNTWKINSSCKADSNGNVKCANSKNNVSSTNLQSGEPNGGVAWCGSKGCDYGSSCSICGKCCPKTDGNGNTTYTCCCMCDRDTYSIDNKCKDGTNQSNDTLEDEENTAWINFKDAVKVVEQLYYDLQNCNFYVDPAGKRTEFPEKIINYYTDLKAEYHKDDTTVTPNKSNGGSIKDYLLDQAYCETKEECVSLVLGYEDDYGVETEFSKNVGNVSSRLNNNYYCKNSNSTKCYEYKQDIEVEIKNSNKTTKHDRIVCEGVGTSAKCWSKTINLPTNDHATFITVTEADFWQPKSYKASVYTGVVSEDDGSTGEGNSTPLGKEVFPVSNKSRKDASGRDKGSTGSYNVNHKYSNLGLTTTEKFDYEYACSYDVYNTTKYYDCETNENGVTDLTKCKNPCYELKDGVPVITDSCDIWTPKDNNSKSYGFIYRNVDVGNLFPGEDIRDSGINWSSKTDVIDAIEKTADKIYTTDDYLEYRYVLTPSNIRQIREYNNSQNSNGGYLNETLENCTMVDDDGGLKSFTECKSSFLNEVKAGRFGDIKVSGSKS